MISLQRQYLRGAQKCHTLCMLWAQIHRDCPHLPYPKPKKPSRDMHLTLRDRHLGGKLHPHWKWFYAVLLTKSFLPRKSQANYLEHPSQMKPRYFSNGTKVATAGLWRQYISPLVGLTPLLQLHGMGTPSFTSKDTQWVFPSLLSNDIQSAWGSMSPRRHSRTWQATFRANLSVIFSRRNTL